MRKTAGFAGGGATHAWLFAFLAGAHATGARPGAWPPAGGFAGGAVPDGPAAVLAGATWAFPG